MLHLLVGPVASPGYLSIGFLDKIVVLVEKKTLDFRTTFFASALVTLAKLEWINSKMKIINFF